MSASGNPPKAKEKTARIAGSARAGDEDEGERKLKRDFLANMSHEMRTPLNAIIGMTDLTLGTKLTAKQKEYLGVIRSSSRALLGLINDILDFSKIDSGKLRMEAIPFSLPRLLEEALSVVRADASRKGLALYSVIRAGTPSSLTGDPLRLKQVLVNLLGNAVKFTPKGSVRLETASESLAGEETVLRFTVTDTGIGIAREAARELFTPFSQADGSTSREYGGTGLGLAISNRLVRLMGGEIGVESEPGKGSAFFFTARFTASGDAGRREVPERASGPDKAALSRLAGARVLVAEDNPVNQTVIFEILRSAGVEVEAAENGRRAVDKIRRRRFDAALMDVRMPVMDGLEAARAIRRLPQGEKLPIIALTAHAMREDREKCLAAGMDDYLSKPITRDALLGALARWIRPESASGDERVSAASAPDHAAQRPAQVRVQVFPGSAAGESVLALDMEGALKRLGIPRSSFLAILRDFVIDFKGFGEEMRSFLAAGTGDGLDDAAMEAHKLAGAAGNIGAGRVRAGALRLEALLLAERPGEVPGELESLERELAALACEIDFVAGVESGAEPSAGRGAAPGREAASLSELLDRLGLGLYEADPVGSAQALECLRAAAPGLDARLLDRLEGWIEDYDMDLALAAIPELRAALDLPPGEEAAWR